MNKYLKISFFVCIATLWIEHVNGCCCSQTSIFESCYCNIFGCNCKAPPKKGDPNGELCYTTLRVGNPQRNGSGRSFPCVPTDERCPARKTTKSAPKPRGILSIFFGCESSSSSTSEGSKCSSSSSSHHHYHHRGKRSQSRASNLNQVHFKRTDYDLHSQYNT